MVSHASYMADQPFNRRHIVLMFRYIILFCVTTRIGLHASKSIGFLILLCAASLYSLSETLF